MNQLLQPDFRNKKQAISKLTLATISFLVVKLLAGCGISPEEKEKKRIELDKRSSELLDHFQNGGNILCGGIKRDVNRYSRLSAIIIENTEKKGKFGERVFIVDKRLNSITPDLFKGKISGKHILATECQKVEKQ